MGLREVSLFGGKMLTNLEKQFFDTFEIPKIFKTTINIGDLDTNYIEIQAPTLKELYEEATFDFETPIYFSWFKRSKRWSEEYPQITDTHYLELISAQLRVNKLKNIGFIPNKTRTSTIKGVQELILNGSILCYETLLKNDFAKEAENFKKQVQQIFIRS